MKRLLNKLLGVLTFLALFWAVEAAAVCPTPTTVGAKGALYWTESVPTLAGETVAGFRVYGTAAGANCGSETLLKDVGILSWTAAGAANTVSILLTGTTGLNLANGTYYFTVTAYDNLGNESAFSAEVGGTLSTIPPSAPAAPSVH